jgi:hypothetical protein
MNSDLVFGYPETFRLKFAFLSDYARAIALFIRIPKPVALDKTFTL